MSNPESWKTWEGRVVGGKFPLRQWLGGSDHSAVFLTDRNGQSDQKAAIKLIPEIPAEAEGQRSRWRAAAQLSHPNLIRIYEIGRCQMNDTPLLYVVMEYAEEDLSQILPVRALAPAEVSEMLPPLLDALSYLHGKGLVHSRIKPSNVLAVGDLLKLSTDQATAPVESGGTGTRRDIYDAPETASGIVMPAGDMWSLGAMLVEALTQKPPFGEDTSPRDRGVPASVAEPFRGIARECLHDDPLRRCSIADIKARMQPAARSVPDPTPISAPVASGDPYRTTWRILIPIAILLMLGFSIRILFKIFPRKPASQDQTTVAAPVTSQPMATPAATSAAPPAVAPASPPHGRSAPVKKPIAPVGDVVREVLPDVPKSAKNTITGTIKINVRVEVDPSGKVSAAKLALAGPSKYFANLTLKAAQEWEFSPLPSNGQSLARAWLLKFRLRRTSTQVDPQPVSH